MDAILDEKLTLEQFWSAYVGRLTPLEFMNQQYTPEIRDAAEAYVESLPNVYGIVRRQTWRESFTAPWQFRKGEIMAALVEALEATEAEWRPHLKQRPKPEYVEAPAPAQPEAPAYYPENAEDNQDMPPEPVPDLESSAESLNLHEEQSHGTAESDIEAGADAQEPMA